MRDLRQERSLIGIEGPYSWEIVGSLFHPELTALPFQTVLEVEWEGWTVVFARSGFTSEYGYKIIGAVDALRAIWSHVSESVRRAGQATLEAAMTQVRQPVVHRDAMRPENVIELGLNWLIDRSKDDYIGREAVEAMWAAGPRSLRVGARSDTDLAIGSPVIAGDRRIGEVTWCTPSPRLDGYVAYLQVEPELASSGLELAVEHDGGVVPVTTMSSPYVIPTSWSVPIF